MAQSHIRNWSLSVKLAVLLLVASVIPLVIAAYLQIQESRAAVIQSVERLLAARAEQAVNELDSIHADYLGQSGRLSGLPDFLAYCAADRPTREALGKKLLATFTVGLQRDRRIRSYAIIDGDGSVVLATEPANLGLDVSSRPAFKAAMSGVQTATGVYVSSPAAGSHPSVAYLAPIRGPDGRVRCLLSLVAYAEAFSAPLLRLGGLAGPGSYATVLDAEGVRIAHTTNKELVFRPAGPLPADLVERMAAEQRFGPDTRRLLGEVRTYQGLFDRARAAAPDRTMFRGAGVVHAGWSYGVGRRLQHIHWTVFFLVPEPNVTAQLAKATRDKALFAALFIGLAAFLGALLASGILRQVQSFSHATARLAAGDTAVRIAHRSDDEFGRLAASFNAMAEQIQAQAKELQAANAELESRVRQRSALLNAVVDNSPAAITVKDLDGRYLLVSEGAAQALHKTKQDLIGKRIHDFLPQAVADRVEALEAEVIAGGQPISEEFLAARPDGIHTYLSVRFPVREDDGPIYATGSIALDITERKVAESRLLVQLERLQLLDQITSAITERQDLSSVHQVVVRSLEDHLEVDFCCILTHDAATDMLTVERVGLRFEHLATELMSPRPARIPIDANGLARCIRGQLVYEPDIEASDYAWTARLARAGLRSLVMAPLQAESRVLGLLAVARRQANAFSSADCEFLRQLGGHVALAGQQAQLTSALLQANADLRQSQLRVMQQERLSALGQMASGIAHDINNAISPASLYVESLLEREPSLSPQARAHLEIISRAIDDVAATVARMREFYRDRDAQVELRLVDLSQLADQVADLTRARWRDISQQQGVQIELHRELDPGLPRVLGVENEIREALTNLVFNALDAMPHGGRLTLRTAVAESGRRVRIEVIDTGVGMDEATRRQCLEPFFTTKGERGTGLGLAMVYGIAQRHEAEIEIVSAPGKGTSVQLSFPLPSMEGSSRLASEALAVPAPLRILLVDDDPLILQSVSDALRADGHAVTAARGGQAGIDAFRARLGQADAFEAIITDLGMPGVDGRRVAQAVKEASSTTPVIMLTGWGQRLADDGEIASQVDVVLPKPPRTRDLRAALLGVAKPSGGN